MLRFYKRLRSNQEKQHLKTTRKASTQFRNHNKVSCKPLRSIKYHDTFL